MVKWTRVRSNRTIDRRGQVSRRPGGLPGGLGGGMTGGRRGGGIPIPMGKMSLPVIILIIVVSVCVSGGFGSDPGTAPLPGAVEDNTTSATLDPATDRDAELFAFMETLEANIQDLWARRYAAAGEQYQPTTLVIFETFTNSACGGADERVGPHYCPLDQTIYIDLDFFRQLASQFGAAGDFAQAYVLAHEVGHHIQTIEGINEAVRRQQQNNPSQANELSVLMELQADCLAGVWAYDAENTPDDIGNVQLEIGDLEEGIRAAEAVGDDRIQEATTGRVNPEAWTHGSAEQRREWFLRGYQTGDVNSCNTFG